MSKRDLISPCEAGGVPAQRGRGATLALAAFAAALAFASPALACSCLQQTAEEKIEQSAAIFVGTALRSVNSDEEGSDGGYTAFQVTEMLKGTAGDGETYVSHPFDLGGNCGIDFEAGKEFFVLAALANEAGELQTNSCLMTGVVPDEIRAVLKREPKSAP